jgi:S-adenosylmethionine hydrolase
MTDPVHAERNCVALLSDFGWESFYVGIMKAVIMSAAPNAQVVDVTHDVTAYAVDEGSFILRTVFPFFPSGAIFVAVIDPGVGGTRNNLILRIDGKYLIAPDNGLVSDLSLLHRLDACWKIEEERIMPYRVHPGVGATFFGRDIFAPAAGALAAGTSPKELGISMDTAVERLDIPPVLIEKNRIEGNGRYVDRFGNVLTDISGKHLFEIFGAAKLSDINIHVGSKAVRGIRRCYVDEPPGTLMVVLNSWDLIEVSVSQGRADDALGISKAGEMHIIISG